MSKQNRKESAEQNRTEIDRTEQNRIELKFSEESEHTEEKGRELKIM